MQASKLNQPLALALALAAAGVGCSKGTPLEPAKSANEVGPLGSDTAFARVDGVVVSANGDTWSGDAEVKRHVTPVWVGIRNESGEPIRVTFEGLELSADNKTYAALPPVDADGKVHIDIDQLVAKFDHERFQLAPHYGTLYTDVEVEPPPGMTNYEYYDLLYDRWQAEVPLPTKHMLEVALPEGRLESGGVVTGFVYFERVPEKTERVTLQAEVRSASTGETMGTAKIPFITQE